MSFTTPGMSPQAIGSDRKTAASVTVRPLLLLLAALLLCGGWLFARDATAIRRHADRYMTAQVAARGFQGAVLIGSGGALRFAQAYGAADRDRQAANTVETRFRIGSVTKMFTATAVLLLERRGVLRVTDPLCRYLDPCPAAWAPITLHHLLSHTSGIPNFTAVPEIDAVLAVAPASHAEVLARFIDLPLEFAPGERFAYSNSGYHLLGLVLERVTGQSYAEVLQQLIFRPLGMAATGYDYAALPAAARAIGYRPGADGMPRPQPDVDPLWSFASGALYSTVGDLARWDAALDGGELVPRDVRTRMWTPVQGTYGYGWDIQPPSAQTLHRPLLTHAGRTPGFTSCYMRFPEDHLMVVVLSNNDLADTCAVARDLAAIVLAEDYALPVERVAIPVSPEILARYVGVFRVDERMEIDVAVAADHLSFSAPGGGPAFDAYPETETRFFFRAFDIEVSFRPDRSGAFTRMEIQLPNDQLIARRVER